MTQVDDREKYRDYEVYGGRGGGRTYRMIKQAVAYSQATGNVVTLVGANRNQLDHLRSEWIKQGGELGKFRFLSFDSANNLNTFRGLNAFWDHYAIETLIENKQHVQRNKTTAEQEIVEHKAALARLEADLSRYNTTLDGIQNAEFSIRFPPPKYMPRPTPVICTGSYHAPDTTFTDSLERYVTCGVCGISILTKEDAVPPHTVASRQ